MTSNYTTSEIKKKKLKELLKRQKGECGICKLQLSINAANLDHIVPKSIGGSGAMFNLRATHVECNTKRAANAEDTPEYRGSLATHQRMGLYIEQRLTPPANPPNDPPAVG